MHAKYEVCTSFGLKVIANFKVDNRQTDKQTQKQFAPIIQSRGIRMMTLLTFVISGPLPHSLVSGVVQVLTEMERYGKIHLSDLLI